MTSGRKLKDNRMGGVFYLELRKFTRLLFFFSGERKMEQRLERVKESRNSNKVNLEDNEGKRWRYA